MCVVELWLRGSESGLCTIRAKSGRFDNERKIRSRKTGEEVSELLLGVRGWSALFEMRVL
jgi:hypothetical protein